MTPPDTSPSTGLFLLSHPGQFEITQREMIDALPEHHRRIPHVFVELAMADGAQVPTGPGEWTAARRELDRQFREMLEPRRTKYPDYRVVYFGSSPVPLAVYLGYLLGTFEWVEVMAHHHVQRTWGWRSDDAPPRLARVELPDDRDRTPGEAVIRVSTSHVVDRHLTRKVVPDPLVEIDIALERPAEDAFPRMDEMVEVAAAFRDALNRIGDRFPGIRRVHLFAAVQPGMALLLGAQIEKGTKHPSVQTYQYVRNAEDGVYHLPAVLVNAPARPEPRPVTDAEKATAARDREALTVDLGRIRGFAKRESGRQGGWLENLLQIPEGHPELCGQWRSLPALAQTPLPKTGVDGEITDVEDSFCLSPSDTWQLDDRWLARLARRIPEEDRRRRALRLLVLHEVAHRGPQGLTRTSSQHIGRFPKVLEEMDYHADVWAMLHEVVLAELQSESESRDPRQLMMQLIQIATETMWAFDDDDAPLEEIKVRRLNRYLIWYWQYLVLEVAGTGGRALDMDGVLSVLAHRPLIELAGPRVFARDESVYFPLDPKRAVMPALAVYHGGKLYRHGPHYSFDIPALLLAVATRDGSAIIDVLRGASEQTVR